MSIRSADAVLQLLHAAVHWTVVYQVVDYYVTRECASCGLLWCHRTSSFMRGMTSLPAVPKGPRMHALQPEPLFYCIW